MRIAITARVARIALLATHVRAPLRNVTDEIRPDSCNVIIGTDCTSCTYCNNCKDCEDCVSCNDCSGVKGGKSLNGVHK